MEKLKEHPTENWNGDILLDALENMGSEVCELNVNRTRTMLSANMKLRTFVKIPESVNKKEFVTFIKDNVLGIIKRCFR